MKKLLTTVFMMLLVFGVASIAQADSSQHTLRVTVPTQWSFRAYPPSVNLLAELGVYKQSDAITLEVTSNTNWQRSVSWTDAVNGASIIPAAEIDGSSDLEGTINNGELLPRAATTPGSLSESFTFGYTLPVNSSLPAGAYDATVTIEANQT